MNTRKTFSRRLLALLMAVAAVSALSLASLAYDYDQKDVYDRVYSLRFEDTLRERQADMGSADFDVDAYVDSRMGEEVALAYQNYLTYENEMHPDVVAYWSAKGIRKELFGAADDENKWALYTPTDLDVSGGKRYPVLFVLRGGTSPIFLVETYGFVDLAAEDDMIIVVPMNREPQGIVAVLEQVKTLYPVDESRLYCAGFSAGGAAAAKNAIENPGLFAAINIGGGYMGLGTLPDEVSEVDVYSRNVLNFEKQGYETAVINTSGMQDRNLNFPVSGAGRMESGEVKISTLNVWERINHCELTTMADSLRLTRESSSVVKRRMGIDFDRTEVKDVEGTTYYIGGVQNASGVEIMRFVGIENCPHTNVPGMAREAWAFLKQFSRDTDTGALIAR